MAWGGITVCILPLGFSKWNASGSSSPSRNVQSSPEGALDGRGGDGGGEEGGVEGGGVRSGDGGKASPGPEVVATTGRGCDCG